MAHRQATPALPEILLAVQIGLPKSILIRPLVLSNLLNFDQNYPPQFQ